jgi:hypothetical protein
MVKLKIDKAGNLLMASAKDDNPTTWKKLPCTCNYQYCNVGCKLFVKNGENGLTLCDVQLKTETPIEDERESSKFLIN